MQNRVFNSLVKPSLSLSFRDIHLSCPKNYRQKIPFQQMYEWTLIKKKYFQRARYPFIPRCHPIGVEIEVSKNNPVFFEINEMKPEFLVPPYLNPKLKPYVSWTTKVIHQDKLDPESLFSLTYGSAIGKLGVKDLDKFVEKHSKEPLSDAEIHSVTKMK